MFFQSGYLSHLKSSWVMLVVPCEVRVFGLCIFCAFICRKCPDYLVSADSRILWALTLIYNYHFYGATCLHDHTQTSTLCLPHTHPHTPLATSSSCCPHCVLILDKNANVLPLNEYTCCVFTAVYSLEWLFNVLYCNFLCFYSCSVPRFVSLVVLNIIRLRPCIGVKVMHHRRLILLHWPRSFFVE